MKISWQQSQRKPPLLLPDTSVPSPGGYFFKQKIVLYIYINVFIRIYTRAKGLPWLRNEGIHYPVTSKTKNVLKVWTCSCSCHQLHLSHYFVLYVHIISKEKGFQNTYNYAFEWSHADTDIQGNRRGRGLKCYYYIFTHTGNRVVSVHFLHTQYRMVWYDSQHIEDSNYRNW